MVKNLAEFEAAVRADIERETELYNLRRLSGHYPLAFEAAKLYLHIEHAKATGKHLNVHYFDVRETGFTCAFGEYSFWLRLYPEWDYGHSHDGEEYTFTMAQIARYLEDKEALLLELEAALKQGEAKKQELYAAEEARKAEAEQKKLRELMLKYPHLAGTAK